jgi:predicted ATPase/DNA-binding XRE family transcriptional regulator
VITDDELTFGDLLRRHRIEAGLSQEALAERAGLSLRGLSDLERGARRAPYRDTALRLPPRPAPLIDRQKTLLELQRLLSETRLLTLTGPGGVGKTRLALELASLACADFADELAFVDLAPAADADMVLALVAEMLEVRDLGPTGLEAALVRSIGSRRFLLVLDNFEQVMEAAPLVVALLEACPELKVVATSREPLRVSWEQRYVVPPLEVPATSAVSLEELAAVPAVALFVQRSQAVQPAFRLDAQNALAVSQLCRRLDGLPLAIELAAAQVFALPPGLMVQRIGCGLDLLRGLRDQPARHASLRAALDWSHALLGPDERVLFRRLSVFAGGWSLEAAEAVCASGALSAGVVLTALARLVEWSLVVLEHDGAYVRYRLLEALREYAAEQLRQAAEGELAEMRRRHALWYLTLADEAARHVWGPNAVAWLDKLGREHDNLRAALAWSMEAAARDASAEGGPTPAQVGLVARRETPPGGKHRAGSGVSREEPLAVAGNCLPLRAGQHAVLAR